MGFSGLNVVLEGVRFVSMWFTPPECSGEGCLLVSPSWRERVNALS